MQEMGKKPHWYINMPHAQGFRLYWENALLNGCHLHLSPGAAGESTFLHAMQTSTHTHTHRHKHTRERECTGMAGGGGGMLCLSQSH